MPAGFDAFSVKFSLYVDVCINQGNCILWILQPFCWQMHPQRNYNSRLMKSIQALLLMILLTAIFSCKKDENGPALNSGLVGKWKLVESLLDPGDGSGTFRTVDEMSSNVVEFKANGDFKEVKGLIYSSVNMYDTFKVLDDKRIELSLRNNPQMQLPPMIWYYSDVTPTTLTLSYGCQNPCSGKFIAIR